MEQNLKTGPTHVTLAHFAYVHSTIYCPERGIYRASLGILSGILTFDDGAKPILSGMCLDPNRLRVLAMRMMEMTAGQLLGQGLDHGSKQNPDFKY
jgi:hypothetical protein